MNKGHYIQAQDIGAIKVARGIKETAAELPGCSRQTVTDHIDRHPAVKVAYREANDITLDMPSPS